MSDAYRGRSKNCVLVQDDVGRAKPTCYDLPHEAHAFGRAEPADMEGAREVTMHWASHVPRPKPGPDCQDFRKINKMAARAGSSSAKSLAEFRRGRDVRLIPQGPGGPMPKVIPSDVIPAFAYGKKSRPSTPITHVVGNQFGAEHEEALDYKYGHYEAQRDRSESRLSVQLTKTANGRIAVARAKREETIGEPKELFKMSKFKKVKSRIVSDSLGMSMSKSFSMPGLSPSRGHDMGTM